MNRLARFHRVSLAALVAAAAVGLLAAPSRADDAPHGHDHAVHSHPGMDFSAWENVAVQEGGVHKSLRSLAVEAMRELAGDVDYKGLDPMEGMFSMAFTPEAWAREPILPVRHPELKKLFQTSKERRRISPLDLEEKRSDWMAMIQQTVKDKDGNPVLDKDGKPKKTLRATEVEREISGLFFTINRLMDFHAAMRIVPTVDFKGDNAVWRTVDEMAVETREPDDAERNLALAWDGLRAAYLAHDEKAFNENSGKAVAALRSLETAGLHPQWKVDLDRTDSNLQLFRKAAWVYLASGLMFMGSYLAGRKMFALAAGGTLALGAAIHIAALVMRGILAGRTPVANLYEASVFIVAAMTVLAVIFSAYYRTRIVGMAGGLLGAFFMGIANNIPLHYGVKIMPLVDALQSYWLHIHVTSMLVSYAFFALAFFVAAAWVVRSITVGRRTAAAGAGAAGVSSDARLDYLEGLNFRIITIGFPVLTAGVILGAVWAAEAWGRPWAFDPKETAAAITWMIYAIYLHCRLFLGWRGARGIWLSILGFAAVVFTYLGVSFFLPGLHSYVSEEGVSFGSFMRGLLYRFR